MINTTLANRYAKALVELGSEGGQLDRFREELAELEREQALILTSDQRARLEAHLQQVTTDLAGFWQRVYKELRPTLSRRYPKHHWPE